MGMPFSVIFGAPPHLLLALVGFGCSLVPLLARVPGPAPSWTPHAAMAAAMGAMAVVGTGGSSRLPLVGVLLAAAVWAWWELPRRREHMHAAVDLTAMALLVLLASAHGGALVGIDHQHGGVPGAAAAPIVVVAFWLAMQAACLVNPRSRPCARDALSSLGMIASMAAMALLAA